MKTGRQKPRETWEFTTDGFVLTSPVLYHDTLYIGSGDNHLYAVDSETGEQEWTADVEGSIIAPPAFDDDSAYFGCCDERGGMIHSLDVTNQSINWSYSTESNVMSTPAVTDDAVYAPDIRENTYALDRDSGTLQWYVENTTNTDTESTPTIVDDIVIMWCGSDVLSGVDKQSGKIVWTSLLEKSASRETSPVVSNDTVWVDSGNGELIGIDPVTGEQELKIDVGRQIATSPVIDEKIAYVVTCTGELHAIELRSGIIDWSHQIVDDPPFSFSYAATLHEDTVYISDSNNLYAIDSSAGERRWTFFVGCDSTAPTVTADAIYPSCKPVGSLLALERR